MSPARFTLEERRVAHACELFEVLCDPLLYEFLDEAPPRSVQELAEKLARSELRRSPDGKEHWLNWVVRGESGAIAGYVQSTVDESKEANVAYVFSPAFWGQGIATASVRRMLEIVVAEYQATTLFIVAEAGNLPSLRLAERLGFTAAPREVAAKRQAGPSDVVLWLRPPPRTEASLNRSGSGRPPGPVCGAPDAPQPGPGALPLAPG
jgi:ribosomal-protein-alanine N-acetyltransferase